MHKRSTNLVGGLPGERPANAGKQYRAEVLSRDEVERLIGAVSARSRLGARNRALLVVMYRGGLRIAEALALRVVDVDPERGTVRVMDGKGHKPRTVGLESGAMAVIQRWIEVRRAAGVRRGPLFCTLSGEPISPQAVRAVMQRAAERAGLERRVHPHGLRHTHSAEWVQERRPVTHLRDRLGHTSLAVTDRYLPGHRAG